MHFLQRILLTSFFFSLVISQQCDYEVCLEFDQNNLNYFLNTVLLVSNLVMIIVFNLLMEVMQLKMVSLSL